MPLLPTVARPLEPDALDPATVLARGLALQEAGALPEAKAAFENLLRLYPHRFDIASLLGIVRTQLTEYASALQILDASLKAAPGQGDALNAQGYCLFKLERMDAAVVSFGLAIEHGCKDAHRNLAAVLANLGRFDGAVSHYQAAIEHNPSDPTIHHGLALPLFSLRRFGEALRHIDRAIELDPGYAEAYFVKATTLLSVGDFRNGWDLFEWRWRLPEARLDSQRHRKLFARKPLWLGDREISGKTILLHAEQGFGDTFQFARFVPVVASLGAKVIFMAPRSTLALMRSLDSGCEVIAPDDPIPPFDMHCPLMSLAKALDLQPDRIPAPLSYLEADAALRNKWKVRLGERKRPRIGLIWFGSMLGGIPNLKSMAFEDIVALTDCDADFFSLQKQRLPGDELTFQQAESVIDLGPEIQDFADTAAIMASLDLIITVDTGPAHLAGALGRPVWVVLPSYPEWRWPDGATTPWYPSARLFRQPAPNDWGSVLAVVKSALVEWLAVA